MDFYSIAQMYNELHERLEIGDVLNRLERIPLRDNWDRMAKQTFISKVLSLGYRLAAAMWEDADGNLENFLTQRRSQFDAYQKLKMELNRTNSLNFNPFAVLIQALEEVLPSDFGR
jgi:glutamate dehydrogenase